MNQFHLLRYGLDRGWKWGEDRADVVLVNVRVKLPDRATLPRYALHLEPLTSNFDMFLSLEKEKINTSTHKGMQPIIVED